MIYISRIVAGLLAAILAASPAIAHQKCTRVVENFDVANSTPNSMSIDAALEMVKELGRRYEGTNTCVHGVLMANGELAGWYQIEIKWPYARISIYGPHQGTMAKTVWDTNYKDELMK